MASIDLMIERYSRIRQEEESKNGLIILAAVYGKMIDGMLDLIIRSSDFYYISAFVDLRVLLLCWTRSILI